MPDKNEQSYFLSVRQNVILHYSEWRITAKIPQNMHGNMHRVQKKKKKSTNIKQTHQY